LLAKRGRITTQAEVAWNESRGGGEPVRHIRFEGSAKLKRVFLSSLIVSSAGTPLDKRRCIIDML
jgi:hypothetical protein